MGSILFVCLGNICRSPAAQGVLMHLAQKMNPPMELHIESCGLGDWHLGHLPDERMRQAAASRGITLSSRAQAFRPEYFDQFDYILAADNKVLYELHRWATHPEHKQKIHLITHFSKAFQEEEIPDPFYGGDAHFELVLDILEDACQNLLEHLKGKRLQGP